MGTNMSSVARIALGAGAKGLPRSLRNALICSGVPASIGGKRAAESATFCAISSSASVRSAFPVMGIDNCSLMFGMSRWSEKHVFGFGWLETNDPDQQGEQQKAWQNVDSDVHDDLLGQPQKGNQGVGQHG